MKPQLLHHHVELGAERHPDRDVFRCGQQAISYEALHTRASQLATCLRDHGVRTGDRVAIRLPPSLESAIAVYGILKAGAVFVPIDPQAPIERAGRILQAGDIRHLVTSRLTAESQADLVNLHPLLTCLIGSNSPSTAGLKFLDWSEVQQATPLTSFIDLSADDPAYVIFTSGSTGAPKGIVHTHFSGCSYARLSVKTYDITGTDRIANFSPLHFDMSTLGYLSATYAGATTVLIPDAYLKLPASLSQLVADAAATIWYSVPFVLIQLLQRGVMDQRDLSALRWVMFGGEPFPPKHLYRLMESLPGARFSNVYGPAEVNQCTYFHVPAQPPESASAESAAIPIGRVWDETTSLIVDADNTPVSEGESGELLIHSSTMMRGYWDGSPTDPATFFTVGQESTSKRYYRTGDIVRQAADGNLMFLGRKDRQVKLRGYRVELDEVEHALASHADVIEAAVICTDVSDDETSLRAVATLRKSAQVTADELRNHIAGRLPSYAVPETIEIRESFPRTTSGKIDRRQLTNQVPR